MISEGYKCADQMDDDFNFHKYIAYLNKLPAQIVLLFALTVFLYANTLNAPFYLDDYPSIVENQAIHNLSDLESIWKFSHARFIGYLSFAYNYASVGSTSTTGYHLVNISIHFLSGMAVLFFFRGLVQASNNRTYLTTLPFLGAVLFIAAPLQTQAITYIVQRLASLAAFFYLASMTCYVYARLKHQVVLFIPVILFALLAFFSKQNTATLPLALLLIELSFFRTLSGEHWKKYFMYGVIAIVITVVLALLIISGFDLSKLDQITRDPQTIGRIPRIEYFTTQLLVLWHYTYLFFVPLTLHIDYDFPIQQSLFSLNTLTALSAHIAVITLAFMLRKKQPLVLFAVLFYYLAHSIESSFIPIFDLVFEHRTYLPNMGLALLTSLGLVVLLQKTNQKLFIWVIIISLVLWFSYLTYSRNSLWNDPIKLYQEETRLSPNKERVWADLGKYYLKERKYTEALQNFGTALNLGRDGNTLNALPTTLLNTYLALLYTNQLEKAAYMESLVPVKQLTRHDKAIFYYMKGNRLSRLGKMSEAMRQFQRALSINPNYLDAKANLAAIYIVKKDFTRAKQLLNEVLASNPSHKVALHYLKEIQAIQ